MSEHTFKSVEMISFMPAKLVQAGLGMRSSDSWLLLSESFSLVHSSLLPTETRILWRAEVGQDTTQYLVSPPLCLPVSPAEKTPQWTLD